MNNLCEFSEDRAYRYTLRHSWVKQDDGHFAPVQLETKNLLAVMWIGLNPSTADEQELDNTLRRVRSFSHDWGFNTFIMTNAFAFRATKPKDMHKAVDPIGPDNDRVLIETARRCEFAVCCWGAKGNFPRMLRHRAATVRMLVRSNTNRPLYCLGLNDDGSPKHPLYVPGDTRLSELPA